LFGLLPAMLLLSKLLQQPLPLRLTPSALLKL
jgi:hypothetical protein